MQSRWILSTSFLAVIISGALVGLSSAATVQIPKCDASPLIRAEPPRDPNADRFGDGPWYVNEGRTIWAGWDAGRWHAGRNKALWIRPAGTELKIDGKRIDAAAPPLRTTIPCCYPTGFQATTLIFAAAGCWRVHAIAGNQELDFVTAVSPTPPRP
jgi:hypothetical protein